MSENDPQDPEGEDPPKTPFDNPFFLPVLLWIFALWFGYDGWFNPEMEWVNFNRYGFFVIVALAAWFTRRALIERRESRQTGESA